MIKATRLLSLGLSACLLATLPTAWAQNAPGPGAPVHSEQRIQEIYKQLNLTDEQKQQLEANKQQHRAKLQLARQEIKACRENLRMEVMKPQLDMLKIRELHARIKTLLAQMEDDKLNSILAVRSILTSEQFSEFAVLMRKHHQEHDKE